MRDDEIAVIIPAYNAEGTIRDLIRQLVEVGFERRDIVVVNDGSLDLTGSIARGEEVTVCDHEGNLGKGMALRNGIERARRMNKRRVVTIDADGQHNPREIKAFMIKKNDYDLIVGQRVDRINMPGLRKLVNRTTSLIVSLLSGQRIPDAQCGFRMIDIRIFDRIELVTANYQTESELVVKAARRGFRIGSVGITTRYDNEKSYIRPFLDTIRFIGMAVRFLWA